MSEVHDCKKDYKHEMIFFCFQNGGYDRWFGMVWG